VSFAFFVARQAPAAMKQAPAGERLFVLPGPPDLRLVAGAQAGFALTGAELAGMAFVRNPPFSSTVGGTPAGAYELRLNREAGDELYQLTGHNIFRYLVILVDGQVAMAPVVKSAIRGPIMLPVGSIPAPVADRLKSLAASGDWRR
jgi:preprotein translocase subunit SecD